MVYFIRFRNSQIVEKDGLTRTSKEGGGQMCNEDCLINSGKIKVCIAVHGKFEKILEIT